MIHLTTDRLIIRDPKIDDIENWHRLLSDTQNMYYLSDIITRSKEESCHNLEAAIADIGKTDRGKYFLVIEEKVTGAFVGSIGYTVKGTTPIGKSVNAGYFILPKFHSKGYVTEAFTELIRFAFEEDGVYRIETGCITENKASERVMQKCGLIKETYRKACVRHDGQIKDRVEYRLLKDEWKKGEKMVYALEMFFNTEAEQKITNYFNEIKCSGISSYMIDVGSRPHITIGCYNNIDIARSSEVLKNFCEKNRKITVAFSSIGVFTYPNPCVFLAPVVNIELLRLHETLRKELDFCSVQGFDYYLPGNWVPHCAVDISSNTDVIYKSTEYLIKNFKAFEAEITNIGWVEIMKPVKKLDCFNLRN